MMMTIAFIVVALSAQVLAWRCAKLTAENEQLREQLRLSSVKKAPKKAETAAKPKTQEPLVWN